jgi:transcription antitermination factor NusG
MTRSLTETAHSLSWACPDAVYARKRAGYTEGGEALLQELTMSQPSSCLANTVPVQERAAWYALWTHSHCEQRVHDELAQIGFRPFLPTIDVWSRRRGLRHLVRAPMLSGYLFLHHAMDKTAYVRVSKVSGVVQVLGGRWDRLSVIPDEEIRALVQVTTAQQRVFPFPYLKEGHRARIIDGPLAGLEGILVEAKPQQGLLVLSVHLLQRSVAVVIDGTAVEPTT